MATISNSNYQNYRNLSRILNDIGVNDLAELATLANEMRTDQGTLRTMLVGVEPLIEELAADHATFKTNVDETKTLVDELHDDHATVRTWITEVDGDENVMNQHLDYHKLNGVIGGSYTMAATAAVTVLGAGFVEYMIGGETYYCDLDTTITLEDNAAAADIADSKFGAWRVVIDRTGAVTTQKAAADQQFASAQAAMLSLASIAQTANTACIGYVTIQANGAAFNIGTTNTNAGTANFVAYYERRSRKIVTGLTAALGAAPALVAGATTINLGTTDFMRLGVRLTQIGADGTHASGDDASTIATTKFGGWLVVTDFAGTGYYVLAATGVAGSVSAMTYADAATVNTALATAEDNLPGLFCPVAKINVQNGAAGDFTIGATNWNAASVTSTITACTWGTYDRTTTAGFDSHHVTLPTIPADITAPIVATLTATKPTAGPATLTATTTVSSPPAAISAPAVSLEGY